MYIMLNKKKVIKRITKCYILKLKKLQHEDDFATY